MKLNAQELRTAPEEQVKRVILEKRNPIYLILENVYDTYNVGGLFRLADALNIEKIYLCGQTEIPPNAKIKKASIGTYKIVPWEYKKTVKEAIQSIKQLTSNSHHLTPNNNHLTANTNQKQCSVLDARCSLLVVAIEQDKRSLPYTQIQYQSPLALIVGNETSGILPETLAQADQIAEIPMWGINKSLNVIVSAAIVSYYAIQQILSK